MQAKVTLTIKIMEDGGIFVDGPVHDAILCFGLLECAKDAIKDHIKSQKQRVITPVLPFPKLGMPPS